MIVATVKFQEKMLARKLRIAEQNAGIQLDVNPADRFQQYSTFNKQALINELKPILIL